MYFNLSLRGGVKVQGEITALLSAACYAVSNLLLRKGQKDTRPSDNGLFPVLTISGIILLFAFVIDVIEDPAPLVEGSNWIQGPLFCVLSGIIATLFGRLALYNAIARIGATRGVIFIAVSPFVTLVIALTVLKEKLVLTDFIGIGVLFAGVVLLLFEGRLSHHRFIAPSLIQLGFVIALLASLFQGIGYSFRKIAVLAPMDPVFAGTLDTLAALIGYIIVLAFLGRLRSYVDYYKRHLNIYVIGAGIAAAGAVFLFFDAVMEIPVSTVSVIMGSQPVIVALLAGIFMRKMERLSAITYVSAILVSFGVVLLGI